MVVSVFFGTCSTYFVMSYSDQLLGDDTATEIVISLLLGAAKSREMFACAPVCAWVCRCVVGCG